MTYDRILGIIPQKLRRSLNKAFGRKPATRRASETNLETIVSPLLENQQVELFAEGRFRGGRDSVHARPSTSDGTTTAVLQDFHPTDGTVNATTKPRTTLDPSTAIVRSPPSPGLSVIDSSKKSSSAEHTLSPSNEGGFEEDFHGDRQGDASIAEMQATLPLSNDIVFQLQIAFETVHVVDKFDRWATRKIASNAASRMRIEEESSRLQDLLSKLERRSGSDFATQAEFVVAKLDKLSDLRMKVIEADKSVANTMKSTYKSSFTMQQELISALGQLAVDHGLLAIKADNEEIPVEEMDFEAEYGYPIEGLSYAEAPEVDVDNAESDHLREKYMEALHLLADAQHEFDTKDYAEAQEEADIQHAYQMTGLVAAAEEPEQFFARHLRRKMEITRNLIEAEELFAVVKKQAVSAGIHLGEDGVEEEESEDEEYIHDADFMAETDPSHAVEFDGSMTQVRGWVDQLPKDKDDFHDAASVLSQHSVAKWPAKYPRDIEIWESGTDIACDWRAEKILEWSQVNGTALRNSSGRALSV